MTSKHTLVETSEHNRCRIEIHVDTEPDSPRGWGTLGTITYWHSRYMLGEVAGRKQGLDPAEVQAELEAGDSAWLPVYLCDHGGLRVSTADFGDRFDSGQVGFIVASAEAIRKEYSCQDITPETRALVLEVLKREIEVYDQYLSGQVYGFIVKCQQSEAEDSCWGFYGLDHCREQAKAAADNLNPQLELPLKMK